MSGCTGACCAAFVIRKQTITDIRAMARSVKRAGGRIRIGDKVYDDDPQRTDLLADMLVPLTPKEANERATRFGGTARFKWADRGHHFTCRHWDEETRLCTIYEDRPEMCRGYPYGDGCDYSEECGCEGTPITKLIEAAA